MDIITPSILLVNGNQGEGKSFIIKYIMYTLRDKLDYGIVFTNTSFDDSNYDFIKDRDFIHPEFNEEKLFNLMKIQEAQEKNNRKLAFVIFDDCLYDEKQWSSRYLKRLLTTVRHYNIFVIISSQYPNHIPLNVRTLAWHIIIFSGFENKQAINALYESYGQRFNTLYDFKDFLFKIPKYGFVYINRRSDCKKIEVMKGPPNIPDFNLSY